MKKLNKLLKAKRIQRGFTQKTLAEYMGYSTVQYISNWERGVAKPPLKKHIKLCWLFDIDREYYLRNRE